MAEDQQFEELLEYLKRTRGFDFGGYKRTSLTRRFDRRMKDVGVAGPREYVDYLEVHPEEFALLFNTILINVTSFFRDQASWDYVAAEVVRLIEPRVVVPMHFKTPGIKEDLGGVETFLKEMGVTDSEPLPKLSMQSSLGGGESETKVVLLEPKG